MPADPKSRSRLVDVIRAELFSDLGNECAECGSTDRLQIDHPWGRDYKPSRLNFYNRWCRYRREHAQGLVRLLCLDCNERIRPVPRPHVTMMPQPF